jgi:V/A-type H+-transporting ATPase subunit E
MDVKLENLIEKIKKEGVESGRQVSEEMIKTAGQDADAIIKKAKKEAERIQKEAEKEARQFRENAELAVKQAARDSELLLKEKITELFDRLLKREVVQALTPDVMKELILKIISKWSGSTDTELLVSEKDKKQLRDMVLKGLKKDLKDTVTIQASPDLAHGFRIGLKDENIYYDFSDESITEMLKMFLNPGIKELLDGNG